MSTSAEGAWIWKADGKDEKDMKGQSDTRSTVTMVFIE